MRQSLVAEYTHWVGSNQKLAVTAGTRKKAATTPSPVEEHPALAGLFR
jgi:hypothetical protein